MPKLSDYACTCGKHFEFTHHPVDEVARCPACSKEMSDSNVVVSSSKPFSTIVPMHTGSLKRKAGFIHSHGDRPAEKGSVSVPSKGGSL